MNTEPCPGAIDLTSASLMAWKSLWRWGYDHRNPSTPSVSTVSTRMNEGNESCRYVNHAYVGPRWCGSPHYMASQRTHL